MNLSQIREQFPALSQKVYGKPLVYLDNGATSQKPRQVLDVLQEMQGGLNGNIHRAVHYLSVQSTERYDRARATIRDFINAASVNEVIFTSGTTGSLNLLAFSFGQTYIRPGDRIVITRAEHHSNIVPWQMMCKRTGASLEVWEVEESGAMDPKKLEQILDKQGRKPKLLAIAHISNVLGLVNPLREIIRIAHYYGVPVVVDGAQGIVHKKVDVQDMDADFYVFSGHKLYGPTGTGVLYGKEKYLEEMVPWQGGGDMITKVCLPTGTTYAPLPLKFEAGTYYGQVYEKAPVFSMSIEGVHPADIAILLDKLGIAARSGMLCAEPLLERYQLTAVLRASFALYNTQEELDFFVESLRKVLKMLR